ncbi:MAG: hypothetical protein WKF91_06050 [Segetibacter sp.]|jgi:phage-related protein
MKTTTGGNGIEIKGGDHHNQVFNSNLNAYQKTWNLFTPSGLLT